MSRTLVEIKEYCKNICIHKDCCGKDLKQAKKDRKYLGIIITPKNEWYCSHPK